MTQGLETLPAKVRENISWYSIEHTVWYDRKRKPEDVMLRASEVLQKYLPRMAVTANSSIRGYVDDSKLGIGSVNFLGLSIDELLEILRSSIVSKVYDFEPVGGCRKELIIGQKEENKSAVVFIGSYFPSKLSFRVKPYVKVEMRPESQENKEKMNELIRELKNI